MDNGPAHLGLVPTPLQFALVESATAEVISSVFPISSAERALRSSASRLGYYKLVSKSGEVHFAKVVSRARTAVVQRASRLGNSVGALGVPVSSCHHGPLMMPNDEHLFVYDWMDGRFFDSSVRDLEALGGVIAQLHHVLPICVGPNICVDFVDEGKVAMARLAGEHQTWPDEAAAARAVIERCEWGREQLCVDAQPIHNDLHPGNVLFNNSGSVGAILDFEEALHARYSPIVDLSWVVERWCVFRSPASIALEGATAFLDAYCDRLGRAIKLPRGTLSFISLWRSVLALSLLASLPRKESSAWYSEWRKFSSIIASLPQLTPVLEAIEDRFQ